LQKIDSEDEKEEEESPGRDRYLNKLIAEDVRESERSSENCCQGYKSPGFKQ